MKCQCGKELGLPALFVGYNGDRMPVIRFLCPCTRQTDAVIETMLPSTFDRAEAFPPKRGEYFCAPDGVQFTCPVCRGMSPIRGPTHQIKDDGKVEPSIVCPHKCGFHSNITLNGWSVTVDRSTKNT